MQFAGHKNAEVFRNYYKGKHCLVDSRAVLVGTAPQTSHLKNVRGYQRLIQPTRRSPLAEKSRQLDSQILGLKDNKNFDHKQLYEERRRHKKAARADHRQLSASATAPAQKDASLDDFAFTKKFMPEREFLAGALFERTTMRSDLGRRVFGALYTLCGQSTKFVHCPEFPGPVK